MTTSNKHKTDDEILSQGSGRPNAPLLREVASYLSIGTTFAATVALLTYVGVQLDNYYQTEPGLTIAGAVLGVVLGFYYFFKTVSRPNKKIN